MTFEPTKVKAAAGASLSSKVKGWTVSGKARAYDQHSHFDFSSGCFKSLQTGVDHSYVHTKQISHYMKQKQVPSKMWSVWDVWGEWDVWSVRV